MLSVPQSVLLLVQLGIDFEFINIGGGLGIPYRPEEVRARLRFDQQRRKSCSHPLVGAVHVIGVHVTCVRVCSGTCRSPFRFLEDSICA
jgi:hypothetical protein